MFLGGIKREHWPAISKTIHLPSSRSDPVGHDFSCRTEGCSNNRQ